jgi:hypothetical protein
MMNSQVSRWFQEVIAVNGTTVKIKAPGLTFAVLPGSYLSSPLPTASQTKSFGMFDSLAAPAVYPIFAVTKAPLQTPYSPHDTSVFFDSDYNPVSHAAGSANPVNSKSTDIPYAAVLGVTRNADDPSRNKKSAVCPVVAPAKSLLIGSGLFSVQPDRAPRVTNCFLRQLDDGSTSNEWFSEVQLNNHLSTPFMVSVALAAPRVQRMAL